MTDTVLDHLKSLHTAAIDARNGYQEALKDAEGRGMTPLFSDMIALHENNATELAADLRAAGAQSSDEGSFMSTVHRTIISVRSLFGGLDHTVLPGLIDGEKRNVNHYDEALKLPNIPVEVQSHLTEQRSRIQSAIARMQA